MASGEARLQRHRREEPWRKKIRTHDLPVMPTTFNLTFDNFRTIRRCRLFGRAGDFLVAAFED